MLLEARIPFRYVFTKARRGVLLVLLIGGLVELVVHFHRDYLPQVPVALPAFLGTAISLLLSFKLNQSYDRWWEARKIWGAIVNDSRTLVRQALTFGDRDEGRARRIAQRQIAWCYCLGQSLRGLNWKEHSEAFLSAAEASEAQTHTNKPLALLQLHARDIAEWAERERLSDYQRIALDTTLTRLTASMGMAERIRNTVFPKTYRLFLQATIYLFIVLLSVSLAEIEGVWQVALTTCIAVPFLLLEKTAKHMQDPFANRPTDTSMTAIARTIEINLKQLVGDDAVPDALPTHGFYVM